MKLCYIKEFSKNTWSTGKTLGMHAKHFIVDDRCYYIGSQNLYIADLAEWGLVIDDERQTTKLLDEYWHPMWSSCFTQEDCQVDKVMDGLNINRDGQSALFVDAATKEKMDRAMRQAAKCPASDHFHKHHAASKSAQKWRRQVNASKDT